jgi:iron complex transport system substrate-binding protein
MNALSRNTLSSRLALVGAAGAFLLALSACGQSVTAPPPAGESSGAASSGTAGATGGSATASGPVSITNCGAELTFAEAPQRAVGLSPAQTELLLRLGVGKTLVGQAQTGLQALPADVASQAEQVKVLSKGEPPAREELLSVNPDLVLSPTSYEFTAEQGYASVEQLKKAGAQAYIATGGCADRRASAVVTDLVTDIDNLGSIFRTPQQAAQLSKQVRDRLAAVSRANASATAPTVAQLFVDGKSLSAIGAGIEADIIKQAGGKNVFSPDDKLFESFFAAAVSPEQVASLNPDAIVFATTGAPQTASIEAYLRETFPQVTAVKENRLVAVPSANLLPGTLGNVDAVELISQKIHDR